MKDSIGFDEWAAELERQTAKRDGGLKADEIARQIGKSLQAVRRMLAEANAAGRLSLGTRTEVRIDGRHNQVPVYRILPAPARKAARAVKR